MRKVIAESGDDSYGSLSLSSKSPGEQKHTRNVLYFGRHGGSFVVGACEGGGGSFHVDCMPSTQVSLAMETGAEERTGGGHDKALVFADPQREMWLSRAAGGMP